MKLYKATISMLLVVTLTFCELFALSSCKKTTAENDPDISKGEFLSMLDEKFGFNNYQSEEPHVKNVGKDNDLFSVVQAAYEWNVIDDSEIDLQDNATKAFVANALVKAADIEDVSAMSEEDISKLAKDKGYITYSYKSNKEDDKPVKLSEAKESLDAAFYLYTHVDYGEGKYDVEWADGVQDLSSLSESDYTIDNNKTKILIPKLKYEETAGGRPEKGKTIVMPAQKYETMKAYKIQSVEDKGEFYELTVSDDADYSTLTDKLSYQFTKEVNLNETTIRDPYGNIVSTPSSTASNTEMGLTETPKVEYIGTDVNTKQTNVEKEFLNLDFEGIHISGEKDSDHVSFTASGKLYESDNAKVSFEKSFEIKNITLAADNDVRNGGFLGLSIDYAKFSVLYDTVSSGKLSFDYKKVGTFAPEYTNGNGKFSTNFQRAILKDSNAKGAKNIKICNVEVAGCPVASIRLEVRLVVSVSGEVNLVITTHNEMGFRYQDGNLSFIKEKQEEQELSIHGKFEVGIYMGLGAYMFGSWLNILSGGATFGFGVVADLDVHVKDDSNRLIDEYEVEGGNDQVAAKVLQDMVGLEYDHNEYGKIKLNFDTCLNVKFYWYITIGLDPECKIKGFLKNVQTEVTIGGENDPGAVIAEMHFEDGQKVNSCTRHYDNVAAETTTVEETTATTEMAAIFKVDSYNIDVTVGGSAKAKILEMPTGYSASDVVFESENTEYATVDNNGNVKGIAEGSTLITAKTKDGKYKVTWSVSVREN